MGLQINIPKTKNIVFRKQRATCTKRHENWKYWHDNIDIVNNFIYLGVTINYTGNFNLNTNTLRGKGLKALNILLTNLKNYSCKPKVALQLFDAFVSSIITYSCELWGFLKCSELEKLHLKFCKAILGVRK